MRPKITLDTKYVRGFLSDDEIRAAFPAIEKADALLRSEKGPGNDFLGWVDLPAVTGGALADKMERTAGSLRDMSTVTVVIGIGGSYLGAKAGIEALAGREERQRIIFLGHHLSVDHYREVMDLLGEEGTDFTVNVISKSGTTTEPAVAYRLVRDLAIKKYGKSALKDRVVCTTDASKGALRKTAEMDGCGTFVIPDDVGGRFSVLTPVGLLPMAIAGINIKEVLQGAFRAMETYKKSPIEGDPAVLYALIRGLLHKKGKDIEIMSNFDPSLHYVAEWWKQLFGESEGKDKKGLFPAACDFTTDLHSMGQWIQDAKRNIFETFIVADSSTAKCTIPANDDDLDGLNYLAGKDISYVNDNAYLATREAHYEGGVPNMTFHMPDKSAYSMGELFYLLEKAVAVSGYALGVNPFDQPGVESYKRKMFKLLGKPGA
jgi:glucose-6-phosphate isomerase